MTLPTHVLAVRAEVPADIEAEWSHWYDTVHLPEIPPVRASGPADAIGQAMRRPAVSISRSTRSMARRP